MALLREWFNLLWFTTDLYVKIWWMLIKETWEDEWGKLYSIEVQVDYYTNSSKEYHFKQEIEKFEKLRLEELSLEVAYNKVVWLEKFTWFSNI